MTPTMSPAYEEMHRQLDDDSCHGDLRQGAFLYRRAAYRLLQHADRQAAYGEDGRYNLGCQMPAIG
jgi:hypothetical protein